MNGGWEIIVEKKLENVEIEFKPYCHLKISLC